MPGNRGLRDFESLWCLLTPDIYYTVLRPSLEPANGEDSISTWIVLLLVEMVGVATEIDAGTWWTSVHDGGSKLLRARLVSVKPARR